MTGDDHDFGTYPGTTGTALRFNRYMTQGPNTAQDVTDWKAVRATSYIYDNTPIPDDSVAYYQTNGFEIALHPTTACLNFTPASLFTSLTTQLASLETQMPSMIHPVSNRTHCLPWSDWATQPKIRKLIGNPFRRQLLLLAGILGTKQTGYVYRFGNADAICRSGWYHY